MLYAYFGRPWVSQKLFRLANHDQRSVPLTSRVVHMIIGDPVAEFNQHGRRLGPCRHARQRCAAGLCQIAGEIRCRIPLYGMSVEDGAVVLRPSMARCIAAADSRPNRLSPYSLRGSLDFGWPW